MNQVYYSGNTTTVLLTEIEGENVGTKVVLDIASVSWTHTTPASPLFDYKTRDPIAYVPGNSITDGSILLNYRTDLSTPEGRGIVFTTETGEHTIDPLDGLERTLTVLVATSDPTLDYADTTTFEIQNVHFQAVQMVTSPDGQPLQYQVQFIASNLIYTPPDLPPNLPDFSTAWDDLMGLFKGAKEAVVYLGQITEDAISAISDANLAIQLKIATSGVAIPNASVGQAIQASTSAAPLTASEQETLLRNLAIADMSFMDTPVIESDDQTFSDSVVSAHAPNPAKRMMNYLGALTSEARYNTREFFEDTFSLKSLWQELRGLGVPLPDRLGRLNSHSWKIALRERIMREYSFTGNPTSWFVGVKDSRTKAITYYRAAVTDGTFTLNMIHSEEWNSDEMEAFLAIFRVKEETVYTGLDLFRTPKDGTNIPH